MKEKAVNDKILMVNSEGLVLGASASCAELLELEIEQLTNIFIPNLNFGLTLTQFLVYFEKIKKEKSFAFNTYFLNKENQTINLVVSAVYVDSKELALFHLNLSTPEKVKSYYDKSSHETTDGQKTPINLSLSELIDASALKKMMDYFNELTRIPFAIIDLNGKIIVQGGWQDICVNFHRVNPTSCRNCLESDYQITKNILKGEFRSYNCKNGLRTVATPICIGDQRMGYIFLGQFFYEDETIDYEYFRKQARTFGFDEVVYLEALSRVPQVTRQQVETAMNFYTRLANYVSQLQAFPSPIHCENKDLVYLGGNKEFERATGIDPSDGITKTVFQIYGRIGFIF